MKDNLTFDTKKAQDFFLEKISFIMSPNELREMIQNKKDKINIADVRGYDDYIDGHIPFAIHIPFDAIEDHLIMLEKDKINVLYSYSMFCKRAIKAAFEITKKGYPTMVLQGGYNTWQKAGYDTVKTDSNNDK